ncbi:ankyrin repeat-containing domain protein [Parachaetomium inaequale]|uniref:Ankyrin repeat-containing domain protein n=1 Tax=Parachaetomium inaequale TaxID=2588326 RepID=A0AAN6P915_9PEZI|nr:ankyrin repeat-containing domain protein [Parachaetomium inaequale]
MDPSEPSKSTDTGNNDAVSRLHQAVIDGDEALARLLLRQNDDIADARDASGRTALAVAVEHAQLGLVPALLDHGADIEAPDASGRTLLHQAVARNNVPLSTLLLERGANVEAATPGGEKPLWTAASQGYELVAKLLLQCKADVEAFNAKSGTTALFEAVNRGHTGLVKLLLDSGADIDARRTGSQAIPLHRAIMNGDAELVKLLLQHGADVGIPGKDGRSAQQVADEQKEKAFAALLRSGLLLEGPEIKKEGGGKLPEAPRLVVPRALPPPRHNPAKMAACRAFEATLMEFYTDGREQRYQQSAPVYDLLYGKGPQAILDAERPGSVAGKTPKFTWYHLPANNVRILVGVLETPWKWANSYPADGMGRGTPLSQALLLL